MTLFGKLQQIGGNLANALRKNSQNNMPELETVQIGYDGKRDPYQEAVISMQTEPRTLSEKLFGKTDSRNFQQFDPETGQAEMQSVSSFRPGFFNNLAQGYAENYNNEFNLGNLKADDNKTFSTRLGEGLGTVGRFIDSPLGRGLIAAGLNKALGYDNSLQEGLTAFSGRQNAVTADKLYRRQLKDYGYSDEDLGQIRGNITSDMYKNLSQDIYRNRQIQTKLAIAGAKDNTTKAKMILDAFNKGVLTEQDALMELASNGIDLNNLNQSNDTLRTQSQVKVNEARAEDIKNPKPKVKSSTSHIYYHNNNGTPNSQKPTKPQKLASGTNSPKTSGTTKNGTKYRIID